MIVSSSSCRCSFSLREVSQICSQLIHTPFWAALASGLEIRNRSGKRQEKNAFYFQLRSKNFLDGKKKRACRPKNRNSCVQKIFVRIKPRQFRNSATDRLRCRFPAHPEFDQIGLCTQFLGSVSRGQTLSKIVDAGNSYQYERPCFNGCYRFKPAGDPATPVRGSDGSSCFFRATHTCRR